MSLLLHILQSVSRYHVHSRCVLTRTRALITLVCLAPSVEHDAGRLRFEFA